MNIVVLDGFSVNPGDLSWDEFKSVGNIIVYPRTSTAELLDRCKQADVLLTNKVVLEADIIRKLPHLKYIGVLATGYNVVDLVEATKHNICVTNIPAYSSDSVAQMTFAHILNITNRVGYYSSQNRNGRWSKNLDFCYWDSPLHELAGKIIGIVGLGNIGMKVALIAKEFGMEVFAYTSKNSVSLPEWLHKVSFEELLRVSDILTLHCPLVKSTREMINSKTIPLMKNGAILINTGRGQLVNEADVAAALNSGYLKAYGTDVMCNEPPLENNPLFNAPNAFVTPHIAWATYEARQRLINIALKNLKAFVAGKPINVVSI